MRRELVWTWSGLVRGIVYCLPALVVAATIDKTAGAALALGALPAAVFPMPALRRRRAAVLAVGALCGAALVLGWFLQRNPVLAIAALLLLSVAASLAAIRGPLGRALLGLGLPVVGVGLSLGTRNEAVTFGILLLAGSCWCFLVSLLFPSQVVTVPATTAPPAPDRREAQRKALIYGVLLGVAASTAAAIGFALHVQHVGWACAALLFVMRPAEKTLVLRAVGRATSVVAGAALGGLFMATGPGAWETAAALAVVVGCLTALQKSEWYVAPVFSTFLVFILLLSGHAEDAGDRFWERTAENLLGVTLALLFGVAIPAVLRRAATRRDNDAALPRHGADQN